MPRSESVKVPDLGGFEKVDVVEVLVSPGDRIQAEDPLITLESDKATLDVPAPVAGTVEEVTVKKGDKVSEGDVILTLTVTEEAGGEQEGEAQERARREPAREPEGAGAATVKPEGATEEAEERAPESGSDGKRRQAPAEPQQEGERPAAGPVAGATRQDRERPQPARAPGSGSPSLDEQVDEDAFARAYASPAVRRFARELGVDLGRVRGSGRKGRIVQEDVRAYVQAALGRREVGGGPALPPMPVIDFAAFGEIERRPLTRIQKIAGPSLLRSWLNIPHVTQHDEADVTDLEAFRKAHAGELEGQGIKLTPLAFVMRACVSMLLSFPSLNSSLDPDGEHLILKRYIHLGFAVDTEQGLVVPVIRDVDRKGTVDIARELAEISGRARAGKLQPAEIRGASFTISSLGSIGGTAFTPIINGPEVAILGVSRTQMRPVWRDGAFAPRLMLPLSLSYDHRVIDGATAVRATTHLAGVLGDIRKLVL